MLLLDDGLSCEEVGKVLYLDDDTVRGWAKLYGEGGLNSLMRFDSGGSASHLSQAQEEALKAWIAATLPRSTRQVGAYIDSNSKSRPRFGWHYFIRFFGQRVGWAGS